MKAKKVWSLLLVMGLTLSCLAGCGGKEEASDTAEDTTKEAETSENAEANAKVLEEDVDPYAPVSDETIVIHVGREETANTVYEDGEDSQNNYIVDYLEKQLNVEYVYDFSTDTASYATKVSMAIASDSMPDVMNVNYLQLVQLVEAGAIEDMTDAFYTYRSESLIDCFDSTGGVAEELATFDGKLMAIPGINPGMDAVPVLYIRGDWMEELGLEEPETLDDVVEIAKTFMEENPGGNVTDGIAVSQEIVQEFGGNYHLNGLFGLFESYPKMWVTQEDGSVAYGAVTEETKEALTQIRELVAEGVIDPAFAVRDSDQCTEMISNGQAGIFFGAWWSNQWPIVTMLEAADDSVSWNSYIAPLNEEGKMTVTNMNPSTTFIVVKKGCSEEIKEAVVKTCNYQHDLDFSQAEDVRPNGMDSPFSWHYFPINVLHCNYDNKEYQIGVVMDCINGEIPYEEIGGDIKTWYDGYTKVTENGFRAAVEENISTANAWGWANGAWTVQKNSDKIEKSYAATYAESPSMESLWTTLETLEEEFFLKVLTGETSIDEFDSFVEQWNALGGDTITQEINEMVAAQ